MGTSTGSTPSAVPEAARPTDAPAGTATTRRLRVLQVSYACAPGRISEAAVGWHRAVETARHCDTWVLCPDRLAGERIRPYVERHGDIPGLHPVVVPVSRLGRWLSRVPGAYYLAYNLWQRRACREAERLHDAIGFDVVHQVTLCGYREPGYLWRLGAPFVWGPIGGTQNFPWRFLGEAGAFGAAREALRTVLNWLQLRWSPRVRTAVREAATVIAATTTGKRDLIEAHGIDVLVMLETGIPDHPRAYAAAGRRSKSPDQPLRLLWSGHCHHFKGLSILLRALGQLAVDVPFELTVVGGGSAERRWRRLAERLGVAARVRWKGWLPHEEALACYGAADAFVFTSLRDTSGNVMLEALDSGLPIVCLDHQGAADIVTDECGLKVAVTTPGETSAAMARALETLARDRDWLAALAEGARRRARDLSWSEQGRRMLGVYRRVVDDAARASGGDRSRSGRVAA